jgi:hypothetical protein
MPPVKKKTFSSLRANKRAKAPKVNKTIQGNSFTYTYIKIVLMFSINTDNANQNSGVEDAYSSDGPVRSTTRTSRSRARPVSRLTSDFGHLRTRSTTPLRSRDNMETLLIGSNPCIRQAIGMWRIAVRLYDTVNIFDIIGVKDKVAQFSNIQIALSNSSFVNESIII